MWLYHWFPFPGAIVLHNPLLSLGRKHFKMSSKRKEYKVDDRAEKAARFFFSRHANPGTKVKVTVAMWVKGYSDGKAANLTLQMQVCHTIVKIK